MGLGKSNFPGREKFGLSEAVIETKDYDIDVCLLRFNKPEVVAEVKWKEKINKDEIRKAEADLNKIKARKRYLFVQDKQKISRVKSNIEIVDIKDFL